MNRDAGQCLVLVHPVIARLQAEAGRLASQYALPSVSIGPSLAQALLTVPPRRQPVASATTLKDLLGEFDPGPVLCTDIDLLFEPTLKLDPLRLLLECSRVTRMIVAWPGDYDHGTLEYAVSEHGHYRTWKDHGVSVVALTD